HAFAPVAIVEVPAYRESHAGLEVVARLPCELAPDLARVDRVATVVSGAILDERLERGVALRGAGAERLVGARGKDLLEPPADEVDALQVGALVRAADVVLLARLAAFEHAQDPLAVVLDEDPVANVAAVAVDRQRLALDRVQ